MISSVLTLDIIEAPSNTLDTGRTDPEGEMVNAFDVRNLKQLTLDYEILPYEKMDLVSLRC